MSVLIKGMKMPKSCGLCKFDDYGYCTMAKQYSGGSATHGIASFCPLMEVPEKHGRLIDADALIKALIRKEPFNNCARVVIAECMEEVRHTSTVIEAEGE